MPDPEKTKPVEGEVMIPPTDNQPLPVGPTSRSGNIFIGTLNLMAAPAKALTKPLHRHYHRKYHGKYKHAKKIFVFDLILIAVALALLTVSLYFFFAKPTKTYLDISLHQDKEITVGETQDLTFRLANLTNQSLSNLVLNFIFPQSFVLKEFPKNFNPETRHLFLEELKDKQTMDLVFLGQFWGGVNETQKIAIHSRFTEEKDKTAVEQIASLNLSLTKSPLSIDWSLPEQIMVGQNLDLTINYRNASTEKISRVVLLPTLPHDFEIVSSHPDFKEGNWILENLEPQASGQINLTGYLRSFPQPGNITLSLQTFLEKDRQRFLQGSLLKTIAVMDHGLILKANLAEKKTLQLGEESSLTVTYQNNSRETVKNLILSLSPAPSSIIEKEPPAIKISEEIAPGESNTQNFTFKLRPALEASATKTNLSLVLRPSATFSFKDRASEILRALAAPLSIKISSVLKLQAEARYFTGEGDQLGRGPLPPKVGQTTKYWINWFITVAPNASKEVLLLGHLPPGVSWTGKTNVPEGEPVKYDPVSRVVSWQSNLAPATPGLRCPCQGVGFEVSITPSAAEIGQTITLLDNLTIQGTDEFTKEELTSAAPSLTTNLTTDNLAKGKGAVQP